MTQFNYALAALGAVATTSASPAEHPPSHSIDGSDVTSTWFTTANPHWLAIDLGAAEYITDVRLYAGASNSQANWWVLQYSVNGTDWLDSGLSFDNISNITKQTGGLTARYWRIRRGSSVAYSPVVYSFEIIGPVEAPPPPDNPADEYIAAWLDGLEANYVPAVQAWLAAQ